MCIYVLFLHGSVVRSIQPWSCQVMSIKTQKLRTFLEVMCFTLSWISMKSAAHNANYFHFIAYYYKDSSKPVLTGVTFTFFGNLANWKFYIFPWIFNCVVSPHSSINVHTEFMDYYYVGLCSHKSNVDLYIHCLIAETVILMDSFSIWYFNGVISWIGCHFQCHHLHLVNVTNSDSMKTVEHFTVCWRNVFG